MNFLQATRYVFPLFKVFAIIPFDISAGPPGQLHIQKNQKCFILGNALLTMSLCFLLYDLVTFWMVLDHLEDYVYLFALGMYILGVCSGFITSLIYHHKYIQFYHELIQISDLHPNTRKYFKTIFYFLIFQLFYMIINVFLELSLHLFSVNYNQRIIQETIYIVIIIYYFAFISQFHLILISTICIFKALNENLLNFQIHFNSFYKLFDIFENIVTLGEWNLLNLIILSFVCFVSFSFNCMVSIIYSIDSRLTTDIWFLVNMINNFVQHLVFTCFLIDLLQREV